MKQIIYHFLKKNAPLCFGVSIIVSVLILAFAVCFSQQKVAVVDMNKVYQEAQVFKQIRTSQMAAEDEWKTQALAQKQALEKADKDLSLKKRRLKKAVFERRVSELKAEILDFQNQQMAKLDLIRYQAAQITQDVEKQIQPFLKQLAQEKDLDLVLSSANVIYYQYDVTQDVIEALDKAYNSGLIKDLEIVLEEGE